MFLETLAGGGAERNMLRLAAALQDHGHDIEIVVSRSEGIVGDWVPADIPIVGLSAASLARSVRPLATHLSNRQPDMVMSAISGANVVAIAARWLSRVRTAVIVTERNTPSVQRGQAEGLRRRVVVPWLMRKTYAHADAIVAVSQGVADDLATFVRLPRDRISVIPNPVVDDGFLHRASQPLPGEWRESLEGRDLILSVGRFEPHKRVEGIVRAFAEVHADRPDTVLALLGDGPSLPQISEQIERHRLGDAVLVPGFVDNPAPWMRAASVFVLNSEYEGLPTVIIEALTCGARVVATDCPSGPREILADGRWGELIPLNEPDALATAVKHALDLGRWPQPPSHALAPYQSSQVVSAYQAIMAEVEAGRSTRHR